MYFLDMVYIQLLQPLKELVQKCCYQDMYISFKEYVYFFLPSVACTLITQRKSTVHGMNCIVKVSNVADK